MGLVLPIRYHTSDYPKRETSIARSTIRTVRGKLTYPEIASSGLNTFSEGLDR
jgi:hypothetical protein